MGLFSSSGRDGLRYGGKGDAAWGKKFFSPHLHGSLLAVGVSLVSRSLTTLRGHPPGRGNCLAE